MTVVIEELDLHRKEFTVLGRVADGEVIEDATDDDFLTDLLTPADRADEAALLDRFNGPRLIAYPDGDGDGEATAKAETQHAGEWTPYVGPNEGEGWQNVRTGEVRYTDEPPGPVVDGTEPETDLDLDVELEPVSHDDLEPGDEVVIEWQGMETVYALESISEPTDNPQSDIFRFVDAEGESVLFKRFQLDHDSEYSLGGTKPDLVGRLVPDTPAIPEDTFDIEGVTVEAVDPADVDKGDELIVDMGDERGEVAVSVTNINKPLEYVGAEDQDGNRYTIGWEDAGNYHWDGDVMGRVVPRSEQTYERDGMEIRPADLHDLDTGDEALVTFDGDDIAVRVTQVKGYDDYRRVWIETSQGDNGILRAKQVADPDISAEVHGEIVGVAGHEDADRYIQGVPATDAPDFEDVEPGHRLFLRAEDGAVHEARVADMSRDGAHVQLDSGESFWIYEEDYPTDMANRYADADDYEDYPRYDAIGRRLPGDELREYEVDGHTIRELDRKNPGAAFDAGDTLYFEGKGGENRRAFVADVQELRSGHTQIVGIMPDGRRFTAADSRVFSDIHLDNVWGTVQNADGQLSEPDRDELIEWGTRRVEAMAFRDRKKVFGNYAADVFRFGGDAETAIEGIREAVETVETDATEDLMDRYDFDYIYRMAADHAMETIDIESDEWEHSYNMGKVDSGLQSELIDHWHDKLGNRKIGTIQQQMDGWSSFSGMMSEKTAALWKTAWREYANDFVADNRDLIEMVNVDDTDREAIHQFRDELIDFFVDIFGPDDGVPDPDAVAPEDVQTGDTVQFSAPGVEGEGRVVWSDGDYCDVRGPHGEIHKLIPDDVEAVTDTRGRVTIPVFKGVKERSSRLTDLKADIRQGKTVGVKQMTLDSWSTDPDSAWDFASRGGSGIVIRKDLPVTDIWAAGEASKRLLEYEAEVVFGHNATHMQLDDEDVQFVNEKTALHDVAWAYQDLQDRDLVKQDTRPTDTFDATYDFTPHTWNWLKRVALARKYTDKERGYGEMLFDAGASNERRKGYVNVADLSPGSIRDRTLEKVGANYEAVDDLLMAAIEKQVWRDMDEIEKAPNMWRRSANVPLYVRSFVEQAAQDTDVLYDSFDGVPHMAALMVHRIIREQVTSPEGWSIETIRDELDDEFTGIDTRQAETIARTEVAAILNTARKLAMQQADENPDVYWSGPQDHRTTDLCTEVKAEIERRGGYITLTELEDLLYQKARAYRHDYGTPRRVSEYIPHYQCRHTFVRAEYQFLT